MRKNIGIGITAATAALAISTGATAALAASSSPQRPAITAAAAHATITKAQARQIAKAKVPHSRVIEVESDDLHGRPVWKVKLATPHGRVIVDVDKKTGKATIVRHDRDGRDDGRQDRREHRHDDSGRDGASHL